VIALHVRAASAHAEAVLGLLLEHVDGLEERDAGETVEFVLYGAPGELPALPEGRAVIGDVVVEVRTEEVADDWGERWKAFHRPVEAGRFRVRPPWEAPAGELVDLVIDPAQAFGTGGHHTTRLCLELLGGLEPGGPLADWGCGTGVLAIAAARLGWAPVVAVDHDPASVAATRENAAANRVAVEASRVDLRREPGPEAPVVVANLVRPLLLEVARVNAFRPELLIVSGLLHEEAAEVRDAFGMREVARRASGEWTALVLSCGPSEGRGGG
jgi:ribosomal protein L11 methyltransferase